VPRAGRGGDGINAGTLRYWNYAFNCERWMGHSNAIGRYARCGENVSTNLELSHQNLRSDSLVITDAIGMRSARPLLECASLFYDTSCATDVFGARWWATGI
jgi:hypothetical protein